MRLTILSSVLALTVAFTGAAFAGDPGDDNDGKVAQRQRPLPQPEMPDDQQGDGGYDQGPVQGGNIQNNVIIENPQFQGYPPRYRLPFVCVSCIVNYNPQFTTVVAIGPNRRAQLVFADFPGYANEILINQVETMKMHGICRNLVLNQRPCYGGCGGNGGGGWGPPVIAPPVTPVPPIYPPPGGGGGWPPPPGGGGGWGPRPPGPGGPWGPRPMPHGGGYG